ncbi:hydroxyacid dehydrogenase [Anaerotruncus colihominis]|uniref:Hydroxyacid dehydrogenase n=1 Tax=Anaerotruncus colihominis TaxID=169435 RepID=A0A845SUV4_9FIRM|nr:hydroxyacid dehydrogenase [Anaerotruncus colihominis]MCR2026003.1 hydroxyacid dehydrogenase [Anaerotruncus colihominis]NDO38092.1 hydroxyacid dehydrogenase [Anaerotruncus colihominis]
MEKKIQLLVTNPNNRLKEQLFDKNNIKLLESFAEITWNPYQREFTADELKRHIQGKDALITSWGTHPLTREILDCSDRLKFIGHTGGTVKWLVEPDFFERGIMLVNGNAALAKAVAEYCFLIALSDSWNFIPTVNAIKAGGWLTNEDVSDGLNGKSIGLVGYGEISKGFIELLKAFDVCIYVYSNYCTQDEADRMRFKLADLSTVCGCDIVSLHTTLNEKTYHMLGKHELSFIRDNSLLINTGRAELIEEKALMDELRTGRFRAVLDVFYQEPLAFDHELRSLNNVICTPHAAGTSQYWRRKQADYVIEDMKRFFVREPPCYAISKQQYDRLTPR